MDNLDLHFDQTLAVRQKLPELCLYGKIQKQRPQKKIC